MGANYSSTNELVSYVHTAHAHDTVRIMLRKNIGYGNQTGHQQARYALAPP